MVTGVIAFGVALPWLFVGFVSVPSRIPHRGPETWTEHYVLSPDSASKGMCVFSGEQVSVTWKWVCR